MKRETENDHSPLLGPLPRPWKGVASLLSCSLLCWIPGQRREKGPEPVGETDSFPSSNCSLSPNKAQETRTLICRIDFIRKLSPLLVILWPFSDSGQRLGRALPPPSQKAEYSLFVQMGQMRPCRGREEPAERGRLCETRSVFLDT